MAAKLCVVLFAFLAVQGWVSAAVISDEFQSLIEFGDVSDFESLQDLAGEVMDEQYSTKEFENRKAEDCVPYIAEAYATAQEVRDIIGKAKELGKKLHEGSKKCRAETNPEEKKKCYQELKKQAETEGKPLVQRYFKIRPKVIESMQNFDKCMA